MLFTKKYQAGFTLIEVVAAAALLGLLVTMAMPSISGANNKVKNSRLKADLATVDQAIQLYYVDQGSLPSDLTKLRPDYLTGSEDIKDATNSNLKYNPSTSTYILTGLDTSGNIVYSTGSNKTNSTTSTDEANAVQ